jgi:hypothetical protein
VANAIISKKILLHRTVGLTVNGDLSLLLFEHIDCSMKPCAFLLQLPKTHR